jgi:hypothetical protein
LLSPFGIRESGSQGWLTRKVPIHEFAKRSGPLDPEECEPSDLGAPKCRHFGSRGCEGGRDLEVAGHETRHHQNRLLEGMRGE